VNPPPPLFEIEVPFSDSRCVFRFLEPPGSSADTIWGLLFDRIYDKPFILDHGRRRFLYFDFDNVQSAMSLEHPDRLNLGYTRRMMAFLLFNGSPGRILLLGLGGGSLAKFCYRRLPLAAITAIEDNEHVIALREQFCIHPTTNDSGSCAPRARTTFPVPVTARMSSSSMRATAPA
jgi:spermidine synthase